MKQLNQFAVYDELPLWSAPFGLTLLDTVRMAKGINILDIGSGGGFPMLELAERFGNSCQIFGLDPSEDSVAMITEKITLRNIPQAKIIRGLAEKIPFPGQFFQLITANNGLNNVKNEDTVLAECYRVSDIGGQLVCTMNLPHTLTEFYVIYEQILAERKMMESIERLHQHIFEKRKPVDYWKDKITRYGFSINTINVDGFKLRFSDGKSFLDHYFIRTAFMGPWKAILPEGREEEIFSALTHELDILAAEKGELVMSIPYVCFDCIKR